VLYMPSAKNIYRHAWTLRLVTVGLSIATSAATTYSPTSAGMLGIGSPGRTLSGSVVDHFTSMSAGPVYACGIDMPGSIVCWGATPGLRTATKLNNPPDGAFASVSAGSSEGCAIKKERGAAFGPIVCWGAFAAAPPGNFTQISGAECGIRLQGNIVCWAPAPGGKLRIDTQSGHYISVSVGAQSICAVQRSGSLICWGTNSRLAGHSPAGQFRQVSAGGYVGGPYADFACALRVNGTAVCFGDGASGPVKAPGGRFIQISSGGGFACALRPDRRLVCWGDHPKEPLGPLTQIAAGYFFVCGLRPGGEPVCTGDNSFGQTEVPGPAFAQASPEETRACGVRVGGSLACWGMFGNSRLPSGRFAQVSLGHRDGSWACALRLDQSIVCWSAYPTADNETSPPTGRFKLLSAAAVAACALRVDGSIVCWGDKDSFGTPPRGKFSDVSVGAGGKGPFACAIRTNASLTCWGDSTGYGERPDGQTTPPAGQFSQVSAGLCGVCALRRNGLPACWGEGLVAKPPKRHFTQISSSGLVTCGVTPDHIAYCWNWRTPIERLPGRYTQVSINYEFYTCTVETNGTLRCSGTVIPPAGSSRRHDARG
jgi:hypothetical protein